MADIQPTLLEIQPWDATKGTNIYFTFTGSRQALENNLVITDVATGQIVYDFEYSSFEKVHPIPANQLTNGMVYSVKIRVKFNDDGTYSPFSNEVEFRTFATPVLDIVNIDGLGHVYNSDVTFVATYYQADNENVKSYRFRLYNENEDLIEQYPIRVLKTLTNEFTEVVTGLKKGKGYFIECYIETVNGVVYSQRERFIPIFLVPSANGVITTENDSDEGFVRVTANLKQIIGTQVKGTPKAVDDVYDSDNYTYIDNEWVVVPVDKPIMFAGLGMNRASDFVMKVWFKDVPSGTKFLDISPEANNGIAIQFWKYDDKVIAVKEFNGIRARYCSNIITMASGTDYMLYVKVIEHRLDLDIQQV